MSHPFCPEYIHVTIPDISREKVDIQETVLIDFQGTYVILSHKSHLPSLVQLFHAIRSVAYEIIVESPQGELFLTPLFSREPVIRPEGTHTTFSSFKTEMVVTPPKSHKVDLAALFPYGESFSSADIEEFFVQLRMAVRQSPSITLSGVIPIVPFVLAVLFLCDSAEVWYEDESGLKVLV